MIFKSQEAMSTTKFLMEQVLKDNKYLKNCYYGKEYARLKIHPWKARQKGC